MRCLPKCRACVVLWACLAYCVASSGASDDASSPLMVGGACCLPDSTCAEPLSQNTCETIERGQFLGEGSTCPAEGCPDCDCDGNTDIAEIVSCIDKCIEGGGDPTLCADACDIDGDGVPQPCQDGSLDPDLDGVIGDCDGCPHDPDKVEPGVCGCGQPDVDGDGDGILDCNDACPNDPDNDFDGDGLCGDVDNCPFNANPDQQDSNGDGVGDMCQDCAFDMDCNDRNACTEDRCVSGSCENTLAVDCPPGQICDPATGTCVDGCVTDADCDDNNLCTFDDKCDAGFCLYKPIECEAGEVCNPLTGECGGCQNDQQCDDGVFCNGVESCNMKGLCDAGTNPCTDPDFPFCDEDNDECDECVIDPHCNDGLLCTTDHCVDGVCDFTVIDCPQNQTCDPTDGQCRFCLSVPPGSCCNPLDGTLTPLDDGNSCTDDICNPDGSVSHVVNSLPPVGTGIGPRAIDVTAQPTDSTHPVALLVTSPNFPCLSRYLDVDGTIVDAPVFQAPTSWGTVTVIDQDIVPSTTGTDTVYEIRAVCDPVDQDTTDAGRAIPFVWGDVNNDRVVDTFDIFCVLDAFQGIFVNCPFIATNLAQCVPDELIDIFDILAVLDAFSGIPFPCAAPCGGGACCEPGNTLCVQLPEQECDSRGWSYQGDGSDCRFNPCTPQE